MEYANENGRAPESDILLHAGAASTASSEDLSMMMACEGNTGKITNG